MFLNGITPISRVFCVMILLAWSLTAAANTAFLSNVRAGIDTSKLQMVDARGLDISLENIRDAAIEKSDEFLVVLAFAGENDEYAKLVHNVAKEQHHKDNKEIFVIIYDKPDRVVDHMAVIYFKQKLSLPVKYKGDKVGAGLSTLIRRVYYDHYFN